MVGILKMIDKKWCADHSLPDDRAIEEKIAQLNTRRKLTNPQEIKARMFLIEQLKSRGFNNSEIAEKLKLTRQTVYKLLSKYS
jgi:DNA-binding NarL/FixJ family response regulator